MELGEFYCRNCNLKFKNFFTFPNASSLTIYRRKIAILYIFGITSYYISLAESILRVMFTMQAGTRYLLLKLLNLRRFYRLRGNGKYSSGNTGFVLAQGPLSNVL